jgi:hypothetical protein
MKTATKILLALSFVGLVGRVATQVIATNMVAKAEMIQRIKPADKEIAALTGEAGEPIGPPVRMIIQDEKAFLPGKGPSGEKLVNDDYLTKNNVYPLQVKTVEFVSGLVGYGFLGLFAVALIVGFLVERRPSKDAVSKPNPVA